MEEKLELNDISDNLLIINQETIERLFQEENKDTLVLYMFYYKTAKWQKHNPIKASDDYSTKCLHWGEHKLKNAKKRLKEMELIAIEKRINKKQQVEGWYVKINYYQSSGAVSSSAISPQVEKQPPKILFNNSLNTINNINKENIDNKLSIQKKDFIKPTLEEVIDYVNERNSNVDPQTFYDYYNVANWEGVKNWKQKLITWEKHDSNNNKKTDKEKLDEIAKRLAYLDEE